MSDNYEFTLDEKIILCGVGLGASAVFRGFVGMGIEQARDMAAAFCKQLYDERILDSLIKSIREGKELSSLEIVCFGEGVSTILEHPDTL